MSWRRYLLNRWLHGVGRKTASHGPRACRILCGSEPGGGVAGLARWKVREPLGSRGPCTPIACTLLTLLLASVAVYCLSATPSVGELSSVLWCRACTTEKVAPWSRKKNRGTRSSGATLSVLMKNVNQTLGNYSYEHTLLHTWDCNFYSAFPGCAAKVMLRSIGVKSTTQIGAAGVEVVPTDQDCNILYEIGVCCHTMSTFLMVTTFRLEVGLQEQKKEP